MALLRREVVLRCCWIVGLALTPLISFSASGQEMSHVAIVASAANQQDQEISPLDRLVTVKLKDVPLSEALRTIGVDAGVKVTFGEDVLTVSKTVSVRVRRQTVGTVLQRVLTGTGITYRLTETGQIFFFEASHPKNHQDSTGVVTGRIRDSASASGVNGAKVTIQGTHLSVVTNERGEFVLRGVPVGKQVVTVNLLGYKPATHLVMVVEGKPVSVLVVMVPTATMLSGVVTTAAGQEQRLKVGSDVTVLNVDSIQNVAPIMSVTDLLATRVPGLIVMPTSGVPGAPSRLRLRGTSGITTSNDPIVIVDGIRIDANQSGSVLNAPIGILSSSDPGSSVVTDGGGSSTYTMSGDNIYAGPSALDQIDPNSIETIEVMKGPSASALYGSDAGNGVIVITTKRGRAGPTRWTSALNVGLTTLSGDWPVNYYRFGQSKLYTGVGSMLCSPYDAACATDSVVAFQALNNRHLSPLQTGMDRGANLTVSGGSSALTYSLTGTASDQVGYLKLPDMEVERFAIDHGFAAPAWMKKPDTYTTYGGTSSLNFQLGQAGRSAALISSFYHSAQQQTSLQGAVAQLSGRYIDVVGGTTPPQYYDYTERAQLNTTTTNFALTLQWPVWPWLPVNVTAGLSSRGTDNNKVTPRNYKVGYDSLGKFTVNSTSTMTKTLNAGTTIRLPHMSTAIGLNVNTNSTTGLSAGQRGLAIGVMSLNSFDYASGGRSTYQFASTATYGWYAQPRLDFGSRLFISPGFRLDGGSASGPTASGFPKVDVSYVAVNRQGQDPLWGMITLIRPRLAFGTAGIQPGPSEKLRLFTTELVTPVGGTTASDAVFLTAVGNNRLRPERSRELEGGLDVDLGQQRVSLSISGYRKTRFDAIIAFPLAPSIGTIYNVAANVGTVRNTGMNATVTARLLDAPALGWNVVANVTQNRNTVLSLVDGLDQIVVASSGLKNSSTTIIRPGFPLNAVFNRTIAGYVDANDDGRIGLDEIRMSDSSVYAGASDPDYELDLSTTMSFLNGRFQFATAVSYQSGLTQHNGSSGGISTGPSDPFFLNNPYLLPLNNASLPLARQAEIAAFATGASDIGMYQTVNLLRWTSLSVSYLLPTHITRHFHVASASVALQGSNLGLHTNYRGKDPSVNSHTAGNLVSDNGQLPAPRRWQLRVTVGQ